MSAKHGKWQPFAREYEIHFYGHQYACCDTVNSAQKCTRPATFACGLHPFETGWCGVAMCREHAPADEPARASVPPSGQER